MVQADIYARVLPRLQSRFGLSAGVKPEMKLNQSVQPTANIDTLLAELKQEITTLTCSSSTNYTFHTIPSGKKRWVYGFAIEKNSGTITINQLNLLLKDASSRFTLTNVDSPVSTLYQLFSQPIPLLQGDKVDVYTAVSGAGNVQSIMLYTEEDVIR